VETAAMIAEVVETVEVEAEITAVVTPVVEEITGDNQTGV
jgi:hypothetical protein